MTRTHAHTHANFSRIGLPKIHPIGTKFGIQCARTPRMLGTKFGVNRTKTVGDITVELYARTTLAVKGRRALYLRIVKVS